MTRKDYVAGIIDGEGSISISQNRSGCYYPRVSVGTTSRALVDFLLVECGGYANDKHPKNPRAKEQYQWYVVGKRAVELLKLLEPRLVIKKGPAQCVLAVPRFHLMHGHKGGGARWLETDRQIAAAFKADLGAMNRRGK